jgi:hypothetical protein
LSGAAKNGFADNFGNAPTFNIIQIVNGNGMTAALPWCFWRPHPARFRASLPISGDKSTA